MRCSGCQWSLMLSTRLVRLIDSILVLFSWLNCLMGEIELCDATVLGSSLEVVRPLLYRSHKHTG